MNKIHYVCGRYAFRITCLSQKQYAQSQIIFKKGSLQFIKSHTYEIQIMTSLSITQIPSFLVSST